MIVNGTILVAHPTNCSGPDFARSVVLITEVNPKGTVGFVLNKQHSITQLEVFRQNGIDPIIERDLPVYRGGPVNTHALCTIHSDEWYSSNTAQIVPGCAISSDPIMLQKMGMGNTPKHCRWLAGMSGWAPGQLEAEVAGMGPFAKKQQWMTLPYNKKLIFDYAGEAQYRKCIDSVAKLHTENYMV